MVSELCYCFSPRFSLVLVSLCKNSCLIPGCGSTALILSSLCTAIECNVAYTMQATMCISICDKSMIPEMVSMFFS